MQTKTDAHLPKWFCSATATVKKTLTLQKQYTPQ